LERFLGVPLGHCGAQEVSFYSLVPIAKSFGADVTETLFVVARRISNPDCSPARING
jgi:hypothetical protein